MFVIDAIDPKAESEGLWFEFSGSKFKIASSASATYQKRLAKLYAPHRKKIEQGKLDPETGQELIATALSGNILTDWKDVQTVNGKTVKFTVELAKEALIANGDLRDFVMDCANDISNYRSEMAEDVVKT